MTKRNSKGQFAKATPVEPKERPIEDWLSELPEPYRAQALEARKKIVKEGKPVKPTASSLHLALMHGFEWTNTPQGEHWLAVYLWASDPANNALPEPWQPPAPATKEEQDYRDALIAEYHLSVGKVTKSVIELNDKLDRIQRDIEQVRTLAHQTRTNSRGNTLVINKILAGVDLLRQKADRVPVTAPKEEVKEQPKEEPWVPKVGDPVVVIADECHYLKAGEVCTFLGEFAGDANVRSLDPSYSHGYWVTPTRNLRPLTTEEIAKHQAEKKAKEEAEKRKKLVRGCRVGTPDGEGIYLGDDGDGDGCEPHRASLDLDGPGVVRAYNLDQITPLP